jgi:hypothetical protein
LPRFLLNGDHGTMSFDLDNVEGAPGDYSVNVSADGPVKVDGQSRHHGKLAAKQRDLDVAGARCRRFRRQHCRSISPGPNGLTLARHYALDVKPGDANSGTRSIRDAGQGREPDADVGHVLRFLVQGTGRVSLSSAFRPRSMPPPSSRRSTAIRSAVRSRSPAARCRCSMSMNWRPAKHLAMDGEVDQRIKDAIDRLLARQGSNGSFGLWSAGGDDAWLDAYVTDFLTRAKERGFEVPRAPSRWPSTACVISSPLRRSPARTAGANLAMQCMCWRAMARRRSAICAISPT